MTASSSGFRTASMSLRSKAMTPRAKGFRKRYLSARRAKRLQAVFSGPGSHPLWNLLWHLTQMPTLPGTRISPRGERSAAQNSYQLVKTPAYRDENVASGKTYWYSGFGGRSARKRERRALQRRSEQIPHSLVSRAQYPGLGAWLHRGRDAPGDSRQDASAISKANSLVFLCVFVV